MVVRKDLVRKKKVRNDILEPRAPSRQLETRLTRVPTWRVLARRGPGNTSGAEPNMGLVWFGDTPLVLRTPRHSPLNLILCRLSCWSHSGLNCATRGTDASQPRWNSRLDNAIWSFQMWIVCLCSMCPNAVKILSYNEK